MVNHSRATAARFCVPALVLLGAACALPGCADDRQATADDVIFLFESSRVAAKTWRLTEPAQGYVDAILKNYAQWHEARAPMNELNGSGGLWPIDSPNWQIAEEINETLLVYARFRETEAGTMRGELTDALHKAIHDVPEIPGREGLAERVVQTIWAGRTAIPKLDQVEDYPVAKGIEVLLNDVQKHMDKLDVSTTGLYFTDAEVQARIHEQYHAIEARIKEMQTADLAHWESFLAEQSDKARKLSPKVKELGATMSDRKGEEYRRQKLRLEFHEDAAKYAEKQIKAMKKALDQDEGAKDD